MVSGGKLASHTALNAVLPMLHMCASRAPTQHLASSFRERTFEMCVPICRCKPLHSKHTIMPRFMDAHSGLGALQSIVTATVSTGAASSPAVGSRLPAEVRGQRCQGEETEKEHRLAVMKSI